MAGTFALWMGAHREKGNDSLLGGVSLEYDPAAGPTKFMVGCEQGHVLTANRKAKHPADRVGGSYMGHHGPVYGLRRCEKCQYCASYTILCIIHNIVNHTQSLCIIHNIPTVCGNLVTVAVWPACVI
jgi:hypothetical protein